MVILRFYAVVVMAAWNSLPFPIIDPAGDVNDERFPFHSGQATAERSESSAGRVVDVAAETIVVKAGAEKSNIPTSGSWCFSLSGVINVSRIP